MDEAKFYQSFTTSIENAPSLAAIRCNVFPMGMGRKLLLPQNFRVRISYRFLLVPMCVDCVHHLLQRPATTLFIPLKKQPVT